MQLKFITTILFLIISCAMQAQAITYNLLIKDDNCGDSNDGYAKIVVTSTNGPFSFLWSTGATGDSISNVAAGNYSCIITGSSSSSTIANVTINELPCDFKAELYFSPNGDGIIDIWHIGGLGLHSNSLVIVYNRIGQKVFEKKGYYEPWDGTDLFGNPVPDGTYYYVIYVNHKNDKPNEKGSVTIIR